MFAAASLLYSETLQTHELLIYTARRCASAAYAVVVCLSVTSRSSIETDERIELGFGKIGASFIVNCAIRKFGYLQNSFNSLWMVQTPDLENVATASLSRCQQNSCRRRRSSLLTTPIGQSTSRGCLLQVDLL